ADQEPSIGSVEAANPTFGVNRDARSQTGLPVLDKSLTVVGMDRLRPSPALRFFGGQARVIEPHLIEEVTVAVWTRSPCCRRNRVDDGGKTGLTLLPNLFGGLAVRNVSAFTGPSAF